MQKKTRGDGGGWCVDATGSAGTLGRLCRHVEEKIHDHLQPEAFAVCHLGWAAGRSWHSLNH